MALSARAARTDESSFSQCTLFFDRATRLIREPEKALGLCEIEGGHVIKYPELIELVGLDWSPERGGCHEIGRGVENEG